MAITIWDVSRHAGVSSATVSRAFSDPDKLTQATLQKVRDAAEQLNYRPNQLATIFRSNKTMTVIVMVPDLSNAFFGPVLAGLEKYAGKDGYSLLLSDTRDSIDLEMECIRMAESRRADGVIQLGARDLAELSRGNSNVPFVHAIEADLESVSPSVRIDNVHAAQKMVSYIASLGHKKIGLLSGPIESRITHHRLQGYQQALSTAGIGFDQLRCEAGDYSINSGEKMAHILLERCPDLTAIFCMSDEIAIGAMKAAKERGLSLPDDLSVGGFDNIEFGAYCEPSLTSVTQPAGQIGEIAMKTMVAMLKNEDVSTAHYVLPTKLVTRESVVAAKT